MKIFRPLALCCSLLLAPVSFSQKDSARVIAMNEKALELAYTEPAKAMEMAERSQAYAAKIGYKRGEVRAILRKGIIFDVQSRYREAVRAYSTAEKMAKASGDLKALASCWNNLGLIHYKNNSYNDALRYFNRAYFAFDKLDDYQNLGSVCNNIGLLQAEFDRPYKAAWFYRKALDYYAKAGDSYSINDVYSNLGILYNTDGFVNLDSSRKYTLKAIDGYRKTDNKYGLGISLNNLGLYYRDRNRPDSAIVSFRESMHADSVIGNTNSYVSSASNLAYAYIAQLRMREAFDILRPLHDSLTKIDSHEIAFKVCAALGRCYYHFGDLDNGARVTEEFHYHHDAYFKETMRKNFSLAEQRFELKASRQRSLFLYRQQQEKHARENFYWLGGLFTLLLGGLLVFFIIRKKNLQKQLESQKAVFEATLEERKRISYDLHDHVGSQLSYVVNNLELIEHSNAGDERIDRTYRMSQAAMSSLRDTVWALHTEDLSIETLAARMENVAAKAIEASPGLSFRMETDADLSHELAPGDTMHIMRIFQEAVHNAVKHASAGNILARLQEKDSSLQLCVSDDGKGMENVSEKPFHYGMQSMKERAARISGSLSIASASGKGTEVCLVWPKNRTNA
jgi:signal transduction histidine kinase/Tfp pilus assembly protein PilF